MKYKPGNHVVSTKHKFIPGERVIVYRSGHGFGPREIGVTVTITDLVEDYMHNEPGYHILEPYGNNTNGSYTTVGETSFIKPIEPTSKSRNITRADLIDLIRLSRANPQAKSDDVYELWYSRVTSH
jgi:hypothetical protein